MNNPQQNSKRLAKNTLMLYFRMLFTMAVSFFTSRVVLQQLGVDDYGIYNVVGGFVAMFSIVSGSMTSAVSRFLTFELGKNASDRIRTIFSNSVIIQLLLALVVIILIESIGVWFLKNKMVIAPERMNAALWVLQCSAITFVVNMISVPYNAAIIAHERMQAFAYISILEVSMKLCVAYMLYITYFDSLKTYAVLLVITALIIRWVYARYCLRHFDECKIQWILDKKIIKEISSYSGWTFIGSTSAILRDQGVNILLNLFGGPAINAARGIAVSVNTAVYNFSQNFMVAVNPQIIKAYASGEKEAMFSLMRTSTKFSYFLLLALSLPLLFEAEPLIHLWLTVVPDYAITFTRLALIFSMSESLGIPLQFVNQATGKIRNYQLVVGGLQLLNFPVSYILLYIGLPPYVVYFAAIIISQICLFARLIMLRSSVGLNVRLFLKSVYMKVIMVTVVSLVIPVAILYTIGYSHSWGVSILVMGCCFLSAVISILYIGCTIKERNGLKNKVIEFLRKKNAKFTHRS